MKNASTKRNKSGDGTKDAPREEMYRNQFCTHLREILPENFTIALEVPVNGKSRADLVVTNPAGDKQVFEFVVHEDDDSIAEHIERSCNVYSQIPNVKEVRK